MAGQTYGADNVEVKVPDWRGNLRTVFDVDTNSSEKTITVPADTAWDVLSVCVYLDATATVGNRQMLLMVMDSEANTLGKVAAKNVQIASSGEYYSFIPGLGSATEDAAGYHMIPFPARYLGPGSMITVADDEGVDAEADDMEVILSVIEHSANTS